MHFYLDLFSPRSRVPLTLMSWTHEAHFLSPAAVEDIHLDILEDACEKKTTHLMASGQQMICLLLQTPTTRRLLMDLEWYP